MLKNNGIVIVKSKSTRRMPLRDVTNDANCSQSTKRNKKPSGVRDDVTNDVKCSQYSKRNGKPSDVGDDALLDRLLLAHSDLSSLTHQIDELVVQALKIKVTNKEGREEIESFTRVLSDMHTSLKPWVPRFQKALASPSMGSKNQVEHSLAGKSSPAAEEDISNAVDNSPYKTKLDSLVSPSPLVSWRAECATENGRQLFLLTPLPRPKANLPKFPGPSKSVLENTGSNNGTFGPPSHFSFSGDTNDDLLESEVIKPTPCKAADSVVTKTESNMESGLVSPTKFSKRDRSMFVMMTPCLKMSPPKSCVLLEPISEISHKDMRGIRKSTPFPAGVQASSFSQDSESSSSQVSQHLALNYLELFGIKGGNKLENRRNTVEESPDWLMSPPKTCILMEPPDEKVLTNAANKCQLARSASCLNQQTNLSLMNENDDQGGHLPTNKSCKREVGGVSTIIESTPMLREPKSIFRAGKRPGENTLKKELWTRFEAASTHGIRFNVSVLGETANRGFLDLLDEVSCYERSRGPEDLR